MCVQFQKLLAEIQKKKYIFQTRNSLVIIDEKDKYGCQMHSTYAYYCELKATGLLVLITYAVKWTLYVGYSSIAMGHV